MSGAAPRLNPLATGDTQLAHTLVPGQMVDIAGGRVMEVVDVPDRLLAPLLGEGGATLEEIRRVSGASIEMIEMVKLKLGDAERRAIVTGVRTIVAHAVKMIADVLANPTVMVAQPVQATVETRVIEIPFNKAGLIIGRAGETIRDIMSKSGAHVQVSREATGEDEETRTVTIQGTAEQIESAAAHVNSKLNPDDWQLAVKAQNAMVRSPPCNPCTPSPLPPAQPRQPLALFRGAFVRPSQPAPAVHAARRLLRPASGAGVAPDAFRRRGAPAPARQGPCSVGGGGGGGPEGTRGPRCGPGCGPGCEPGCGPGCGLGCRVGAVHPHLAHEAARARLFSRVAVLLPVAPALAITMRPSSTARDRAAARPALSCPRSHRGTTAGPRSRTRESRADRQRRQPDVALGPWANVIAGSMLTHPSPTPGPRDGASVSRSDGEGHSWR